MEMLEIARNVAREKNIEPEIVIEAMEEALQKAGKSKYGHQYDIRATIDRKTGDTTLKRVTEVVADDVEEIENEFEQVRLTQAKRMDPKAEVGMFLEDDLPPLDFGRIAAQTAKQTIVQKVREAEREKQFEEYKDRVGEIVNGVVKRVEYGNVTVDLGRAEAIIRRDEGIPRETLNNGDRVRAYIYDVRQEQRGPQIFLSRSHPQFMAMLFAQEVPEIYEGVIEVKAVARDPGSRAKIAVYTVDGSIDPVGACVGMRGSRVQAVVNELQGEKIDIVPWNEDLVTFTVSALAPAEVAKVVLDHDANRMDVVVPDEQLSLAIGRRGQNVRLASILTGWDIDIMTEEDESKRRAEEFKTRSELFMTALDVDEVIAQLLVAEGFVSVEDIAESEVSEISAIEGFDEDVAAELHNRATAYLEQQATMLAEKKAELGITDDLAEFEGLNADQIITLGENGVKTLDDLADLAADELQEFLPNLDEAAANSIIMKAREHWFAEEDAANDDSSSEEAEQSEAGQSEENDVKEAANNA